MNATPEQRQREFAAVERTAMVYLRAPETAPTAQTFVGWRCQLLLWHFPSFAEHRAWAVFDRREARALGARTMVRQVTWDRMADSRRFAEPMVGLQEGFHSHPTIEVRDRPLDSARFEGHLAFLRGLSFPPFASQGSGIDGELFGVSLPERGASLEWWGDGPDSWRAFASWSAEVRAWLHPVAIAPPAEEQRPPAEEQRPLAER